MYPNGALETELGRELQRDRLARAGRLRRAALGEGDHAPRPALTTRVRAMVQRRREA
jgi:hypothetical protein